VGISAEDITETLVIIVGENLKSGKKIKLSIYSVLEVYNNGRFWIICDFNLKCHRYTIQSIDRMRSPIVSNGIIQFY
jgi:hypothetical protein